MTSWDRLAGTILASQPDLVERLPHDPQAHLELISLVATARSQTAVLLSSAVSSARRAGCTWSQIGDVLGITRQAAQQQYGIGADEDTGSEGPSSSMVLAPISAFDEMDVLVRAGRYGWHSVGYGIAYHRVERDDHQWEHARTFMGAKPAGEGWQRIGFGWAWWRYWARPLDIPALAGNPTAEDIIENHLPRQ